jgi:para-aminobenzoate synthetase component 1
MARDLEMPYDTRDRCEARYGWFEALRALGWAVFLDSGDHARTGARYDILAAEPEATLVTRGGVSELVQQGAAASLHDDPFDLVRVLAGAPARARSPLPFSGGLIGYFGYEMGRSGAGLPARKAGTRALLPELAAGRYPWAIVIDHVQERAVLASLDHFPDAAAQALRERVLGAPPAGRPRFRVLGDIVSSLERADYLPRARRVLGYIREGDCYQVNLTREFSVGCEGDPWALYRELHLANPAPMGAFLEYPFGAVLSSSPERFVTAEGTEVVTRPIKGTRRRAADPAADRAIAAELLASEKDRAENVMIVDLLRNDLGRVCAPGSVAVPQLCALESFANVHHLVSTVTGRLAKGRDALDLLQACFPGGSITGAPKQRAMQIIDELEPHRREVYCGAIGYLSAHGRMDMSIPIRTTVAVGGELRFHAGGGIVADSSPEGEFAETETKINFIRRVLSAFTANVIDPEKAALRREIQARREALGAEARAALGRGLAARLFALPQYRAARSVLLTMSFGTEWDTRPVAERVLADGKLLVIPRVIREPRRLELRAVADLAADLVPGVWGIEEPDPARCPPALLADLDLALVPALACDRAGFRLGYGAGYFDRLLAGRRARPYCVAAVPEALFLGQLPHEDHDVRLDCVITEERIHVIASQAKA